MGWQKILKEHEWAYGRSFIRETPYEREFIVKAIIREFPSLSKKSAETAFDSCRSMIPAPPMTAQLINKIAESLEGKMTPNCDNS